MKIAKTNLGNPRFKNVRGPSAEKGKTPEKPEKAEKGGGKTEKGGKNEGKRRGKGGKKEGKMEEKGRETVPAARPQYESDGLKSRRPPGGLSVTFGTPLQNKTDLRA